jgi:type IX secretion system PorP/SprF family membrane protein
MRKLIVLVFTIFFSVIAFSQQFPLQSQYQFNYSVINPSVIVENDFTSVRASFRQQWVGFSENPIATQYLSLYKGFGKNGLGINVFNDETGGALNKTGLSLSYAHKVVFSNAELYFGLSGGAAKVNISNISDPAIINNEDIYPEVLFGAYLKKNDFRFGISIPGLLNQNMELTSSSENTLKRNLYTMLSYEYELNKDIILLPSVLVKTNESKSQIDANLNLKFSDKIWVGASYRQDFGASLFIGLDLGNLFSIYSYDVSTNDVYTYSKGSHEFTIGYDFNSNIDSSSSKISTKIDEFLFDRDKDGIKDSVDLCPDKFGSLRAHGCLDNDNDGIPNEYDLCPNLYGEINLQGCPEITQFEKNIVYNALNDLNFDFDKADIIYSSYPTLTDMNLLLLKNPKMFLHITGFSSSEGSEDYNLGLSARRAKAVQNFFIKRGVKKSRLILDYYGESRPLNDNQTEFQKSLNRRVEFSLEYHIYDISEANILKMKYIKELNNKNLDVTFLNLVQKKSMIDVLNFNESIISNDDTNNENIQSIQSSIDDSIIRSVDSSFGEYTNETISIDNNELNEELIKEKILDSKKYILVISVLSNEANAKNYISNAPESRFVQSDNKYYIYEETNDSKEELTQFKKSYNKDSWIKEVK